MAIDLVELFEICLKFKIWNLKLIEVFSIKIEFQNKFLKCIYAVL